MVRQKTGFRTSFDIIRTLQGAAEEGKVDTQGRSYEREPSLTSKTWAEFRNYSEQQSVRAELSIARKESRALDEKVETLRRRVSQLEAVLRSAPSQQLFSPTAPVMQFARELCLEIFPGQHTIEVACAPDDPSAQWYVFHVFCTAEMQEALDREVQFGLRLHDAYPNEAGDIRLAVSGP